MKKLIRFLGSVTLAIPLILTIALFVVIGTILESKTDSHLYAGRLTYQNPIFYFLLILLAVNLVTAALFRWPFKKKHIPFLTAHVGLLMILAGTALKAYYGTQGNISLLEGSGGNSIVKLSTEALTITKKNGETISTPMTLGRLPKNPDFETVAYFPHSEMSYTFWTHQDKALISGIVPLTFGQTHEVGIGGQTWELYAVDSSAEKEITKAKGRAKRQILIIREPSGKQTLAALDRYGLIAKETFDPSHLESVVVYDKGFGGYAVQSHIPFGSLDWDKVPQELYTCAYWSMILLDQLNEETKRQAPWKYLILSNEMPAASLIGQLSQIADSLPEPPESVSDEEADRMQSLLMRVIATDPVYLETPLTPQFIPKDPQIKLEDNVPLIVLKHKPSGQHIPIGFDRNGAGIKWPILEGEALIHYHPEVEEIPHHVRLRQGRQINYPGSAKAMRYEADLIIDGEEVTISMNRVHETWDGTRFYLANVSENNGHEAKRVQIVVNRDPAKYWLTYPGGFVVGIGMILLWGMAAPRKKKQM